MSDILGDIGGAIGGLASEAYKFLFEPYYLWSKTGAPVMADLGDKAVTAVADTIEAGSERILGMDIKTAAIIGLGAVVAFSFIGSRR